MRIFRVLQSEAAFRSFAGGSAQLELLFTNLRKTAPNDGIIVRNWISGNIQFSVWSFHGHARFYGTEKWDKLNVTEHGLKKGIKFHNAKCRNYEFEKKWLFFEKTAGRGELPRPGSNKTKAKNSEPAFKAYFYFWGRKIESENTEFSLENHNYNTIE